MTSTTVRAQAFIDGYNPSIKTRVAYNFVDPNKNGILWNYYEGDFEKLPDFNELESTANGKIFQFSLEKIDFPSEQFAAQFKSYIEIGKDGEYEFYLTSNDGSKLYIDDKLIVDNDGLHGPKQISSTIYLTKGRHEIRVDYFQNGGNKMLELLFETSYQHIPGYILFTTKD